MADIFEKIDKLDANLKNIKNKATDGGKAITDEINKIESESKKLKSLLESGFDVDEISKDIDNLNTKITSLGLKIDKTLNKEYTININDDLFKNIDNDVKISMTALLSHILRYTTKDKKIAKKVLSNIFNEEDLGKIINTLVYFGGLENNKSKVVDKYKIAMAAQIYGKIHNIDDSGYLFKDVKTYAKDYNIPYSNFGGKIGEYINLPYNEFIEKINNIESKVKKVTENIKEQASDTSKQIEEINKTTDGTNKTTDGTNNSQKEREKNLQYEQNVRRAIEENNRKEIEKTKRLEEQTNRERKSRVDEVYNKVTSVLSRITNAVKRTLSNIISIVRKLNNLLNSSIRFMINGFSRLASGIRRILTLFGNFGNRVRNINRNGNILKGTFTELKSKIDLLVGAFRTLANNEFLQSGIKLLSSVQSLNMLIGKDLTANTIEWANNLEKSFGISASGLITNLQSVSAVLYGMGMSSNNVYNASRNIEALGMTMSSITGLDFDTVITKIDSGMKGMTQSIDDLGLSVRESQMDAFLQKLKAQGGEYANIGTKFQNLTEEQRIYVRYAAIMDQFMGKSAFSAESYAKSLNTLTGQISIFKQQVQQLKATIGTLFLKLLAQIIQPLTYIVYLANQAVKRIAAMFGIDLQLKNTINELGGGGIDTSGVDSLTDSLNDAKEAADEANGGLSALDHITSLNNNKNKSSGNDAFDYSKLADYNANYADMLEELGKMNDDYLEQCKKKLLAMIKAIKNKITNWFYGLTGRILDWDVIDENLKATWENIKKTLKYMINTFKNVFNTIGGIIGSVLDDLDFTTLLNKLSSVNKHLWKLADIITKKLQPHIQKLYDKYLSPYVIKFGDWLEGKLDKWDTKLKEWIEKWESDEYDDAIANFFDNILPEKFQNIETWTGNVLNKIREIVRIVKIIASDKLALLFDTNNDKKFNLEDIHNWLAKIKGKIDDIVNYVKEHKDNILKLLSTAVWFVIELGKAKIKVFEEIFKFVVEHADLIQAICKTVIDLINFAIEHPLLSLTIAIGASLAGETIKIGGQVAAKKLIEKLLFGGTTSKVVGKAVGGEIGSGILSKIRAITAVDWAAVLPIAGIVALIVAEANAAVKGTKDVVSNYKQAKKSQDYGFDLHKLKMQAYEMKQVLDKAYGDANDKFSEEHKSLVIETYANDLRKSGQFTEEQIQYYTDTMTKWLDTFTDNKHKWLEVMTYSSSSDDTVDRVNRIANAVVDYEMTVKDTSNGVANSVENAANSINNSANEISNSLNNADTSSIKSDFAELGTQMKQIMTEIRNMISIIMNEITAKFRNMSYSAAASLNSMRMATNQLLSQITNAQYRLRDTQSNATNWNTRVPGLGSGIKITKARGFANGGIPQSGSLFFANENGNPELVANFGGYTGVANKETIVEALRGAIGTSNNNSQTVNITNNFNIGYMVSDNASLAKLTRAVTAKQKQLNYNVANNNFIMT